MSRFVWHKPEPQLEDGVDRGVIFPPTGGAIVWHGLVRIDEVLEATEVESYFIEGVKVGQSSPVEDFSAVVESFTYPDVLDHQDFVFGFSYRSNVGVDGAYQLHFVYNATVDVPSESFVTTSAVIDPSNFIFVLDTAPVTVRKNRPLSHIVIVSTEVLPNELQAIEDALYGTDETDPTLPTPEWLMELVGSWALGYGHGLYGHHPYGGN